MAQLAEVFRALFPDAIIYLLTFIVFMTGILKCCRPVLRNAGILRRATDSLKEGAKAKLSRPVWSETSFLGKRLQPIWRAFLHSADVGAASGVVSDVADYINDDTIITEPGRAALADMIPGLCTSFGILGTFIGLAMGLNGLDVMEIDSYSQLTGGIAFAFNTSIVGLIFSITFNFINRYAVGKAQRSLDTFTRAFYTYGIPQPSNATTQMLSYEREQADSLSQLAEDMSARIGEEIQRAISTAMAPVQRSMDAFMSASTRAQVEGLDYIVARFVERMNKALDGELKKLAEALSDATEGQAQTNLKLQGSVQAIADLTQNVVEMHGVSEQVVEKFTGYVSEMGAAYRNVSETQEEAQAMLGEMADAAERQSKYLSALQEYQSQLQASFRDYTVWTDQFVGGLEDRTAAQSAALEQTGMQMRASAELLQGAYKGFTESIEMGLANALGVFDENMQRMMADVGDRLAEVQRGVAGLDDTMRALPVKDEQGVK